MPVSKSELKEAMAELLDERNRVDAETHHDHHCWIQAQIAKEAKRIEMYEKITSSAAQWAVLAILGLIWAWVTGDKSLAGK